jgi:hypothetical protein
MKKQLMKLSFCLLMVLSLSLGLGAIDVGWMQPGVRAWYFGGVGLSGDMTSNAVEAYLIQAIAGGNVQYVRHSALEFWTSPKPVENLGAPVTKGSFWIHPAVLQTLAPGDFWLDQEILTVAHNAYTYATFGEGGMHYSLLPAKALFDLKAQREIVKVTFQIDNFSIGTAFFDAETGLALMRNSRWQGGYAMFFILGEINYDFAQQAAFAEDGGPHCGFKSRVAENALPGGGGHAGGMVDIQSGVETRYESKIEMWVMSTYSGPYGLHTATENYYFDGNVPIVRRINHEQAGDFPPEQWNPFGQYLPWWLPPTVTQGSAFSAVSLAVPTINVFDVSMIKTADQPLTYTATQNPQRFYFSTLWFDSYGYLTKFSAKDPSIGLDIDAGSLFGNETTVYGLSYYRNTMGVAIPVGRATKNDFNGDGQDDILWRYSGSGGKNLVWYMKGATRIGSASLLAVTDLNWQIVGTGDFNRDGWPDILWRYYGSGGKNVVWYMKGASRTGSASLLAVTDLNWQIVGTGDFDHDGWPDILWRYNGSGGKNVVWYMKGASRTSTVSLPAVADLSWQIVGTGDFNRDGWPDILWRYNGSGGKNVVWYMKGAIRTGTASLPAVTDLNWRIENH